MNWLWIEETSSSRESLTDRTIFICCVQSVLGVPVNGHICSKDTCSVESVLRRVVLFLHRVLFVWHLSLGENSGQSRPNLKRRWKDSLWSFYLFPFSVVTSRVIYVFSTNCFRLSKSTVFYELLDLFVPLRSWVISHRCFRVSIVVWITDFFLLTFERWIFVLFLQYFQDSVPSIVLFRSLP